MNSMIVGLLAETNLHPGCDSSGGVVDLPVAREATTSYPVLMGSGLKGALRDAFQQRQGEKNAEDIFGKPDSAGSLSISDGRLLLLPVRSLTRNYLWVTCPYMLERFERDLDRAGYKFNIPKFNPAAEQAISSSGENLYLEELSFAGVSQPEDVRALAEAIKPLICHQSVQNRLEDQIAIISDNEFVHFAKYGLPVNARNVLDQEKKTSNNLWYEETIPADSVFYTIMISRAGKEEQLLTLQQFLTELSYIQLGGNETVGQGWCAVTCWKGGQ